MQLKKNIKPTEQEVALQEWLKKNNVTVTIFNAGVGKKGFDGENWEHDRWVINVSRPPKPEFSTEFSTGVGLRVLLRARPPEIIKYPRTLHAVGWMKQHCVPNPPEVASVFSSYLTEGGAADECFEDWADNFGYDKDSRKAEKAYEACKDIGFKVRGMFTPAEREELRVMLEDY